PRDLPQGGNPAASSSSGSSSGPSSGINRGGDGKQPDARRDPDTTAASLPKGAPLEEGRAQGRRETTQTSPDRSSESLSREATSAIGNRGGAGGTAVAEAPERVKISPLARRLASDKGIDLRELRGSGPGGRIHQRDVINFRPA